MARFDAERWFQAWSRTVRLAPATSWQRVIKCLLRSQIPPFQLTKTRDLEIKTAQIVPQCLGQPIDVDNMGIEIVREPFFEFAMPLVAGIGDGLEELAIAPGTTDVLGRAVALGFTADKGCPIRGRSSARP